MQALVRAPRGALLFSLLLVAVAFPASAHAVATVHGPLTRTVFGYGTIHVAGAGAPADLTSPASTPQSGSVTSNDGATGGFESCVFTSDPSFSSNICSVTVTAVAPSGWTFSSWGGDCAGTVGATCTKVTYDQECDYTGPKPPCQAQSSPMDAVANFTDTRAPTTLFILAPANNAVVYSDTPSQSFAFHTDEDAEAPSFACRQESAGVFGGCSSGYTWSSLADGVHDFCVHATDASGLQGGNACVHWEQESNPTASVTTPASGGAINPGTFAFSSNKASHPNDGSTLGYVCTISGYNGGAEFGCANPLTTPSLGDGAHTLTVKARFHGVLDGAGATHDSPGATRTFTVDTAPPTVSLSSGPANGSVAIDASGHATFGFTAADATTGPPSVQCKLDGGSFGACTSSTSDALAGVADGEHDFTVKATDGAGLSATTTAHWEQETPADAALDSAPAAGALLASRTAHFAFHSTKTNRPVSFQCALDSNTFGACGGATSNDLSSLADGAHTLQVRAVFTASIDGSQHAGPAVSRTWTVDATAPDTTIATGPAAGVLTSDTGATFTFTSSEAGSFRCSVDGGPMAACTSPKALSGLGLGTHTFSVVAVDAAGNADPSPATRSWQVISSTPPPLASVSSSWKFFKRYTKLSSLNAVNVPAGATITLSCTGKKGSCKFKFKTIVVPAATAKVALASHFKKARLAKGTKIDLKITKPGIAGIEVLFTTRNGKLPVKKQSSIAAR